MFVGVWNDVQDIIGSFGGDTVEKDLAGAHIIYARYSGYSTLDYDYEMWARVLYVKSDKLYEVHGSHCSCYGLEDQWKPDEVNPRDIISDIKNNSTWRGDGEDYKIIIAGLVKFYPSLFVA